MLVAWFCEEAQAFKGVAMDFYTELGAQEF